MSDDNQNNSRPGSAQWGDEARALARAEAERHATAGNTRPLPPQSNTIPDSALPPGLSQAEKKAYIERMVGRANSTVKPDVNRSTDFKGPVPRLDPENVNPRSPWGSTRSLANLEPNGTVDIAGTQINAEHAVRLGVLLRNPAGGYMLPSVAESAVREQAERQAQEQQQQEQQPDQSADVKTRQDEGELPDNDGMVAFVKVAEAVDGDTMQSIVVDTVMNNGQMSLANVIEAGQRAGMSAEEAQTAASNLYKGRLRQAETAAKSVGIAANELSELWSWCQDKYRVDHAHAVQSLALGGDVSGIKALARKFAAHRRGNR